MSQNVGNSHNPLYITWILPPPLLPPKKKVFDQNLPQYPLYRTWGPNFQFSEPNEITPTFATFGAWLATELNEIKPLRTQLF